MTKYTCLGLLGLFALTLIITGCNTVRGVGKDIHDSAANVQDWMSDKSTTNARVTQK